MMLPRELGVLTCQCRRWAFIRSKNCLAASLMDLIPSRSKIDLLVLIHGLYPGFLVANATASASLSSQYGSGAGVGWSSVFAASKVSTDGSQPSGSHTRTAADEGLG